MDSNGLPDRALPRTVGLFGQGLIGTALARRLIGAGIEVHGFDPDEGSRARFEGMGGQPVPADAVWQADVIVSAVFDTDQLAGIIGEAPANAGRRLISVSTCDPERMPGLSLAAAQKGVDLVEAPISGSSADFARGEAIIVIAGDEAIAQDLAPLFEVLARTHYYVGAIGNGNRAKLAINLVLGLTRAAVAEGVVFAKAVGLDPGDFLELALDSAAASSVMASKGPLMVARDFRAQGRIAQSAKDFRLIRDMAERNAQGLPLADTYLALMEDNLGNGEGDLDNSAVLLAIERAIRTSQS